MADTQLARLRLLTGFTAGLVVVGVLALIDLLSGANLSGTLAAAPLIAAGRGDARRTAVVGVAATAVAAALAVHDATAAGPSMTRVIVVAMAAGFATAVAAVLADNEQRLAAVQHVADVSQHALLLRVPARVGRFKLASVYQSASKEAQLGGDFYALVDTIFGPRLIIGDVRGKGIDGLELAAVTLRCFRDGALTEATLQGVIRHLEGCLADDLHLEDFVTAIIVQFGSDGSLVVVNCGHHPPVRISPSGWELLDAPATTPFGLGPAPEEIEIRLQPHERLLLYTDGLVEARRPNGEFIDFNTFAPRFGELDLNAALEHVIDQIRQAAGGQLNDDVAAIMLERD